VFYMTMQRYELEAWLGDNHGLTDDQITELLRTANEIDARYPDPDDTDDRETALTVAYRLLLDHDDVVDTVAADLSNARATQARALAALRQAAITLIPAGLETQAGFAQRAGIDRMTVRGWLGLRR
jgi:hypothetical protein